MGGLTEAPVGAFVGGLTGAPVGDLIGARVGGFTGELTGVGETQLPSDFSMLMKYSFAKLKFDHTCPSMKIR